MQTEFKKIQTLAFFALLIGVGIAFYKVIAPFLYSLFWAAVLAGIFYPVYTWFQKKLSNDSAAAGVTVIMIVLLVLLPLAGFFGVVAKQAIDVYNKVSQPETIASIQRSIQEFLDEPGIQEMSTRFQIQEKLQEASANGGKIAVDWLTASSLGTISVVVQFCIMLYTLYFFFKNGEAWLKRLMFLLPLGDDNERTLYNRFISTSRATLKGNIIMGGIQGTIGGVIFFLVGIPSATFWGLVMTVAAMVPAIGTIIVWAPAAIIMFVTGHAVQGFMILCGGVLITVVDNLVRPPLVGKDIQMHPVVILFATLGGLVMFGMFGVVIGPLIASLFMALLEIYQKKYRAELSSREA